MRRPQKEIPLDVIDKRHKSRIRSVAADHKTPQTRSRSTSQHRSCLLSVSVSCPAENIADVDVDSIPGPGHGSPPVPPSQIHYARRGADDGNGKRQRATTGVSFLIYS